MSDDGHNLDEEVFLAEIRLREALSALAVALEGEAPDEEQRGAVSRFIEQSELHGELGAEARALAMAGVRLDQVPAEPALDRAASLRLGARLALLSLRCGAEDRDALVDALAEEPLDLVRASLIDQLGAAPLLPLDAALFEFLAPSPVLRAALAVSRASEPQRKRVGLITPARYRHPLDLSATRSLQRALPFEDLARRFSEAVPERIFRLLNSSSNLRVGPKQLPELYALYQGCVERLGVYPEPPLYVARGGFNAYTAGIEQPFIVVHDLLVGMLSEPELEFVIGHELGHIKFDHVLYNTVARLANIPGALLNSVPVVGPLITKGIELALFEWSRKAELSCDRAGLLACQDPQAIYKTMMRMAGGPSSKMTHLSVERFLRQYDELEGQFEDLLSSLFYVLSTAERSHPWTIVRAHELSVWIEEGHYDRILAECPGERRARADLDGALAELAGAGLKPPADPRAAIRWLAGRVRSARLPEFIAEATEALAEEADDAHPQVAVIGARFRRRSELSEALGEALPELEVLDTPDLDESAADFEAKAVPALLRARAVVAVLSAAQLLGQVEREVLSGVLRHFDGPVALAVGRMDAIETDEDAQDVQLRVERFSEGLENAAIFPLPVDGPPEDLARWLRRACAWEGDELERRWELRARSFLAALGRLLEAGEGVEVDLAEGLRRLQTQLSAEHYAALDEAQALLAAGFADVRQQAPALLTELSAEQRVHEGVADLIARVAEVSDRAGQRYLRALQGSLVDFGAEPLAQAVDGLEDRLTDPTRVAREAASAEPQLSQRGAPSGRLVAAAIGTLSLGALFIPGAPVWVAVSGLGLGAASLLSGQQGRAERERALLEGHVERVDAWLDSLQVALSARLDEVAAGCLDALEQRLALIVDSGGMLLSPGDGERAARVALRQVEGVLDGGGEE